MWKALSMAMVDLNRKSLRIEKYVWLEFTYDFLSLHHLYIDITKRECGAKF